MSPNSHQNYKNNVKFYKLVRLYHSSRSVFVKQLLTRRQHDFQHLSALTKCHLTSFTRRTCACMLNVSQRINFSGKIFESPAKVFCSSLLRAHCVAYKFIRSLNIQRVRRRARSSVRSGVTFHFSKLNWTDTAE